MKYLIVYFFLFVSCLFTACSEQQELQLDQIVQNEQKQLEAIQSGIRNSNPDPAMTIYSHQREGAALIHLWDSLENEIFEIDTSRLVANLELAQWNLYFNMLEQQSIDWWANSYTSAEQLRQIHPILLQSQERSDLTEENGALKKSECNLIQLEMILLSQLELVEYFQVDSPQVNDILLKCHNFGMISINPDEI